MSAALNRWSWKTTLLLASWLTIGSAALRADDKPLLSEYVVNLFDIEQGLPQNSATAMAQTPDGCLWFGTWGGLTRYDGSEFNAFTPVEVPELPTQRIVNVYHARDGRLWVSTLRGMACLKDGAWTALDKNSGWVGNYVRSFAETAGGELYATTFNGKIMRCFPDRFAELPPPSGSAGDGLLLHVAEDGGVWVVTPRFVGRLERGKWQETISARTWAKERFQGMASGRAGALWIITKERVRKYSGGKLVWEAPGAGQAYGVWQAVEDSQGTLWVGTMGNGLLRLTPDGRWRRFTKRDGLPANIVRSILEDREGTVWIGTETGGLVSLRPRIFHVWGRDQGMPEDNMLSVATDKSGRVFAGTFQEGASCIENRTVRRVLSPGSTRPTAGMINAVLVDRRGWLWMGAESIRVETTANEKLPDVPETLRKAIVNILLEDSRGRIWIGADNGLHCYDGTAFHYYTLPGAANSAGATEGVLGLAEAPNDGAILVSSNRVGALYRLHDDEFAAEPVAQAEKGSRFVSVYTDPDGTIWLGVERVNALACVRNGRLSYLTGAQGLPAGVHSFAPIIADAANNLWMGCAQGIVRVPRADLQAFLEGSKSESTAQLFTKADGLPTKDCSATGQTLAARDIQGKLWFATVKGLVQVEPERFRMNPAPPVIAIDKVLRDGVVVADRGLLLTSAPTDPVPVVVPPGSGRLEIHYSGLSLGAPDTVRHKYMVGGMDKDWIDVGNHRVAYLQPLGPGTYQFHVKAANNHGVWNEAATTLVLEVQPFYWETAWYRTFLVAGLMAAAGLAAWGMTRSRLRRQIERFEQQRALAREQARLASVLEATSDLVAFLDESGNVLYLNPAGRRMAGLAGGNRKCTRLNELHPRWARDLILKEGIPAARTAGTWSGETAILHGDGREIPVSQVIAVHYGEPGLNGSSPVSFLSTIARDISERKQAEEQLRGSLREKEALLKEIHHRVKNNLQLINSLLALQAARVADPATGDLLTESQNRVRTMALVHENLYRAGNLASIPLARHVESLCAHVLCSYGAAADRVQLDTHVDDVSIDLDRAVPCGLIINELLSNALKHAFPKGSSGKVWVACHTLSAGNYALVVRDNGVGLPASINPAHAESMGLQLVSDLTAQLGGTLTVERSGGTTFTICFRAEPPRTGGMRPAAAANGTGRHAP
jgi:PAS domain S-box-containing protein